MTLANLELYDGSTPTEVIDYINNNQPNTPRTDYVGWLEKDGDEVIYRVWAYRNTKTYGLQYREVIRSILGNANLIYRDMYFTPMGGYKVVFDMSTNYRKTSWGYSYIVFSDNDFGRWWTQENLGVYVYVLNLEMLKDTKFKYSGYQGKSDLLEWMRTYVEYPEVEFLGKLGFPPSKKLLKKASKDKAFCKYIAKQNPNDNLNAICYAYDHNMTVKDAEILLWNKQEAGRIFRGNQYLKKAKINSLKAWEYVKKTKCNSSSYCDYIEACVNLGLNMKDTKNAYPEDFKTMHTLRINQWDAKKNKRKYAQFKKAAVNYIKYEFKGDKYSIIIPKQVKDLRAEGDFLHHCVGKMGYDARMIKGESFIAFVRKNNDLNTPYVTVEVACKTKKILQCYGKDDKKPVREVSDFVNAWSKEIQQIA